MALAGLALPVLLSACMQDGPQASRNIFVSMRAPEKVAVFGGQVIVAGPEGYCVDRDATRKGPGEAFVLMASCADLTRHSEAPHPDYPTLLAVSVVDQTSGSMPPGDETRALTAFFATAQGRAALARDGDPAKVTVVKTWVRDGVFIVHVRDRSAAKVPGLVEDAWRAIFTVNGYVVSATAMAMRGRPISDDAGLATVRALVARIQHENAPGADKS